MDGLFFLKGNDLVGKQEVCTELIPWKSLLLAHDKSSRSCFSSRDLLGETQHEWAPYTVFERCLCKKISSHVQCKLWVQFLSFALISSVSFLFCFVFKREKPFLTFRSPTSVTRLQPTEPHSSEILEQKYFQFTAFPQNNHINLNGHQLEIIMLMSLS